MKSTAVVALAMLTFVARPSVAENVTRYYRIPPDLVPGRFAGAQESNDVARVNHTRAVLRSTPEAITRLFKDNDAELPTNAMVHYSADSTLLSVATPEASHRTVRSMLRRLGILASAIRIDFAHIVFKRSDIDRVVMRNDTATASPSDILALWREKKGRSEISSTFYVYSGVNSQLQSVQEIPYPAEAYDNLIPLQKPTTNQLICGAPLQFETRQVGWIVNVTASLCDNLDEIDVIMTPEVTWPLDDNWRKTKTFTRPPIFSTRQVSTSLRVRSGVPWVSGGFRELPTDDVSYFICTCTAEDIGDEESRTR